MKFGMLDSEWEHKKEAALQYLIQAAEEKRTVYYHELANRALAQRWAILLVPFHRAFPR